jgi:hypothetical protein
VCAVSVINRRRVTVSPSKLPGSCRSVPPIIYDQA